ncbi:MAG TPA: amino acid-binding protein [Bacteroidales bacterium]|nr:amino acid-binding protein [Bacteroidales bacterium]HOX75328.1 amino acid-binding protein [Bacteroidales bacterium]HPM87039.1 amino acid-binding protein [Bacteroidales bacterium]
MIIQQLSVFLENKSGRLTEVLEVLGKEQIRITALSVADTTEFGILRIIVTDPEKAKNILREQKFAVNITGVIAVNVPDEARYYAKVLKVLSDIDISVEYTYAFTTGKRSVIILRCNNNEEAIKALGDSGIDLLAGHDLYKI